MKQAFNPYLPSYEYVPDGEPYVFGDRVYVYGSHDKFNGTGFCQNDYVCWSAPVNDLGDWRYEGFIFRKEQEPNSDKGYLYAPDVQLGPDGRYYLYYGMSHDTVISVAVCDTPAGEYQFYGHVRFPDGTVWGAKRGDVNNFDPGIFMDEDGKVYLYSGFSPSGWMYSVMSMRGRVLDGAYCVELEHDMLTIKKEPKLVVPGQKLAKGTNYEGHAFFEASSMRKINGKYYFVYSSELGHELCYAVSDRPDGGFEYGGTIVSIGDIGLNGNKQAKNYLGNTHGGMVEVLGQWYVFYHRQTNGHEYSRQGCAEKIEVLPDGRIPQIEITSCGLNDGPLKGKGEYEARIACNLSGAKGAGKTRLKNKKEDSIHPYFTQSGEDRDSDGDQYIANMHNGAHAGFKYFDFIDESEISVIVRGNAEGILEVRTQENGNPVAQIKIQPSSHWIKYRAPLGVPKGKQALFFVYQGKGTLDFKSFKMK